MTKKQLAVFSALALTTAVAYAALPFTFNSGSAAKASEVNANFLALESRIAALESTALTAADVVGTYKILGTSTSVGGKSTTNNATDSISVAAVSDDASVTFTATSASGGTFSVLSGPKARAVVSCGNTNDQTNDAVSGTNNAHSHGYKVTDCNANIENEPADTSPSMGTWSLGSAPNTITVNPPAEPGKTPVPLTVFISKRGGVGFSLEVENADDANNPGKRIQLEVFVKQ